MADFLAAFLFCIILPFISLSINTKTRELKKEQFSMFDGSIFFAKLGRLDTWVG